MVLLVDMGPSSHETVEQEREYAGQDYGNFPARREPPRPHQFMSALSSLHGSPTDAETAKRDERRQEFVDGLNEQVLIHACW